VNEEILPRGAGEVVVALGYPNTRAVAAGNLGFQILARILAGIARLRVERFFLPASPPIRAEAGRRGRAAFGRLTGADLVLMSLSYEGDAPAVPGMLAAGGLPAFAAQRRSGHPLVVAGGAAVMINPEPLAAIFDLFLIGEAEEIVIQFLRSWGALRGERREQVLAILDETVPGALAPGRRLHRVWVSGPEGLAAERLVVRPNGPDWSTAQMPDGEDAPGACPVAPGRTVERVTWSGFGRLGSAMRLAGEAEVGQACLVELARGCPRRCRFCAATRIYAPLRECPADVVAARVRAEVRPGETVGLLSLSAGDYAGLEGLAEDLSDLGVRMSISSLPASFARPEAAARLIASGTRTLTMAPETGTERLRALIGKPIADEAILRAASALAGAGLLRLRTYFIIGLPFEEEADVSGIGVLLELLRDRLPGRCSLAATVNAFVPKPRTPFQWAPMAPLGLLRERAALLRRSLPRGVELRIKSFREARLQALLSRGDASWGPRLARIGSGASVRQALHGAQPGSEALLGPVRVGAGLPWAYLLGDEESEALEREWLSLAGGPD
jgi:radical SAM superfamily enzyme YgiQ (UPF0313 family)